MKPLAIYYLKMAYISSSGEFPLIIVSTTLGHIYHSRVTFELAQASSGAHVCILYQNRPILFYLVFTLGLISLKHMFEYSTSQRQ